MPTLPGDPAWWSLVLFVLPLLMGAPIGMALGVASIAACWLWDMGLPMISYNFYANVAKFPLLAIPFFIMAGVIMERAGIARRIIDLVEALVGEMPGGLAVATVLVATFWGAVSGSGPATVAALGLILIPGMAQAGYDKAFAAATVSVSSGLAIIIPPSIAFIVYGVITETSIGALFAAGVLPGLVMAFCLAVAVFLVSRRRGYRGSKSYSLSEKWSAFRRAFWGLLAPAIILGGIYGGVFTPTEAAAVAVFYGLFVGFFVYRTLSLRDLHEILVSTTISTAVVMLVVACAGLFSWVGSTVGLMDKASAFVLSISRDPVAIMLLVNVVLLLAGMVLDAVSIYYVFLPIFMPIMRYFGWDPVWFGVIMTINLAIGQVTPPVAVNLYVGSNISGVSIERISVAALPLIAASVVALLICILFPSISTVLPSRLGLM